MNEIHTLDETLDYVRSDDYGKWDTTICRQRIQFWNGSITVPEECCANDPFIDEPFPHVLVPTPWATSQLCQRLGIPTAYFKRCPAHLKDSQGNWWLSNSIEEEARDRKRQSSVNDQKWLLRVKDNELRAVLSERYTALDNFMLLESAMPFLENHFNVDWFALTDESMHLRLVDYQMSREVLPNDRLFVGVHISNSEVGKRSVTVDAIVYRLICKNGLIRLIEGKNLLNQRHIFLSSSILIGALETAIHEALTVAAGFVEQLSWATQTPVRDVEAAINALVTRWNLSQLFADQVRISLLAERPSQQETVYGFINALTNTAQRLAPDDRYGIETLAGRLLESSMSRNMRDSVGLRLPQVADQREEEKEVLDLCA